MSDHLDQFMQRAANILDNISANFRLLRDRIDPAKFQPFCDQILQLARKVQVLRYNDEAIPENENAKKLAREAVDALQDWLDLFENYAKGEPPPSRGRLRTPRQALLQAIVDLGQVIEEGPLGRTD